MFIRNTFSALAMVAALGLAGGAAFADETANDVEQRLMETADQGSTVSNEEVRLPDYNPETIAID
ncbi:MAG: hypothetical protein HQ512_12275 [Rhodospirillales bacterium]|nr:hypothetical protein [Rhodospirillales bacterium]